MRHSLSSLQVFPLSWRWWRIIIIGVMTFLIASSPLESSAQPTLTQSTNEAPVVIDGRVIFNIKSAGNLNAVERADIINKRLGQELRLLLQEQPPRDAEIEVSEENQTEIDSKITGEYLLSVTQDDVINAATPEGQARFWSNVLQDALRQAQKERTFGYYQQQLPYIVGIIIVGIVGYYVLKSLGTFASNLLSSWLSQPNCPIRSQERYARLFLELILKSLQFVLWSGVILALSQIIPQARALRYQTIKFITYPLIPLGDSKSSAITLIIFLACAWGLWFGIRIATEFFRSYVLSQTGADQRAQELITLLLRYVLTFLGLVVLLQSTGLDLSSVTVLAGTLGVGIGLGLQSIANNFISGLIITLERPIQAGDFVKVGDLMGTVEKVGARSTTIYTIDRVTIILPNSQFLENEVINWSHGSPMSRLRIPIGVAYGSDIELVKKALLEAVKDHSQVLLEPKPGVWFQEFADSSLNFDLLVWIREPKNQEEIRSDLNYRIEANLNRYGIEIPFPQRDLHLRSSHLDLFVSTWLKKYAPAALENSQTVEKSTSLGSQEDAIAEESQVSEVSTKTLDQEESENDKIPIEKVEAIMQQMRESGGLDIQDRRYRLNTYPKCFIGSEAVDWLVRTQNFSRAEGIEFGEMLIQRGVIHHVVDQHSFQDEHLFYRFYADET